MVSTAVLIDVEFDSSPAWEAFTLDHGLLHQTVYEKLISKNLIPDFYPMMDFPREENEDYLLTHYQVHQSNARLLGLPSIVDLSTVDLDNQKEYYDWLQLHASVHANENLILGITP